MAVIENALPRHPYEGKAAGAILRELNSRGTKEERKCSFLKKRTKKLLVFQVRGEPAVSGRR
jgi:hypothetical protein